MLRALVISAVLFAVSDYALAETCVGVSDDGKTTFAVSVTKGDDGRPERVVLAGDAEEQPSEFFTFDDITPRAPTDERFRLVFHDGTPDVGEIAVMLLEGGFTQRLSAQIWTLSPEGEEPTALATLNCRR